MNPTSHAHSGANGNPNASIAGKHTVPIRASDLHEHRGFTLVELLVVIAIVAVLALISTMGVSRGMSYAKASTAMRNPNKSPWPTSPIPLKTADVSLD